MAFGNQDERTLMRIGYKQVNNTSWISKTFFNHLF